MLLNACLINYIQVSVFKPFTSLIIKLCGGSLITATFPLWFCSSLNKWAPFAFDSFSSSSSLVLTPSISSSSTSSKLFIWQLILLPFKSVPFTPLWFDLLLVVVCVEFFCVFWLAVDDDWFELKWLGGEVAAGAVAEFDVVKHLVLKLFPMQTTMTFELLLFDCVDWVLSVL